MKKQTALELYHIELKDVKKAYSWFDEKMKTINRNRAAPGKLLAEAGAALTFQIKPGGMYAFAYDPLTKETLPYYDTFPLIFPLNKTADTFLGLNMHYLPYPIRFEVFRELLKINGATNLTNDKKMLLKWETIVGVSKLAPLQAAIKRYRFDHIASPFIEIKPTDWPTALLLPTHRFKKASVEAVWSETKLIRGW